MTEATAYRLKQIMTQEHLSLTQAAKQIGISASSMRKVLKDTPMSRPITFKINRFIEEHPVQQAKNSFTIFDSAEEEAKSAAPKKTVSAAKQAPQTEQKAEAKPQNRNEPKQNPNQGAKPKQEPKAETQASSQPRRRGRRQQAEKEPVQAVKANQPKRGQEQPKAKAQQHQAKPAAGKQAQNNAQKNQQPDEKKNRPSRRSRKAEQAEGEAHRTSAQTAQGRATQRQKTRVEQPRQQSTVAAQKQETAATASHVAPTTAPSTSTANSAPATKPTTAPTKSADTQATEHTDNRPARQDNTILIYIDESFGGGSDYQRNMSIGATVVDPDDEQALQPFMQTLYPFGWQPGDEVKARGKAREQLESMLRHANTDRAATYAVYSPLSDTGNFSLSFGILYPYVAALIRILAALPTKPTKVRVAMDQRSEITDDQLAMAARMLHAYVKAQTGRDVIFMFRTTDSKQTIGVQYSDFVSHAAMIFGPDQIKSTGIHKLPAIGTQLGDQLQLFAMVGLQKYLLDDGATQDEAPQPFKNPLLNAADRMTHLAEKAADIPDVPEDTFAQAKLVVNQLLQIAPSSVAGAINKMPFQNWYDILARTAALLHYTDESLPPFRIDPDAMQIATDALNNIQALLAGAR